MPLLLNLTRAAHVVFEIGIAAVDDRVAGLHVLRQFLHRLLGGTARRHHDPRRARRLQFADQIFQRRRTAGAFAGELLHRIRAQIRDDELMSAAHQAARHVRAHAAQTHHSQLHLSLLKPSVKPQPKASA